MTKKIPLLIGAILMGAVSAASAQGVGSSTPSTSSAPDSGMSSSAGSSSTAVFAKLDKDQDGMLSKSEAGKDAKLKEGFKSADTSKDGKLDPAEFAEFEAGASTTTTPGAMTP